MNYSSAYVKLMNDNNIPFISAPTLLLRYGIADLDMYPYPIKYLLNTYGRQELTTLTDEEIQDIATWEEKYDKIIIGVIHPTAIGNFCWTYSRFCEYVQMNKNERTLVGICKGWHPLMDTVKNFEVPNVYLYKKFLTAFPAINVQNVNAVCHYLCYHPEKLDVFDYTSTAQLSYRAYQLTLRNKEFTTIKFPPQSRIAFSANERKKGAHIAHTMGIWNPYVCFFARDNAYIRKAHRNTDESSFITANKLRNADVNSFSFMAENLQKNGIQAVRRGSIVEMKYTGNGIDYSSIGSSEFMDVYLFSQCMFAVLYDSGIDFIPIGIFSKPTVIIAPAYMVVHQGDGFPLPDLVIYSLLYDEDKKVFLTLREILSITRNMNFYIYNYYKFCMENHICSIPPTPEDIWEVAKEMVSILNKTQVYSDEDIKLQQCFKNIVAEYIGENRQLGGILGRIGIAWLRKNQWFLA